MKRRILLTTLTAGAAILTLSSYGSGPFAGGAGNRTGITGTTADCSTGGCHNTNSSATAATFSLKTLTDQPVTTYTPGVTYKVTINGTNTGNLARFGFQATCVKSGTATQAGTLIATASNTMVRTAATPDLIEHNTPIAGTTPGTYTVSFNWTAPAAGTGTVQFHGMLNAVNFNNQTTGDAPNIITTLSVNQGPSAGVQNMQPAALALYPNPAVHELRLKLAEAGKPAHVTVRDLSGRLVMAQSVPVANNEAILNVSALSAGSYLVVATQGSQQYAASFIRK